MSAPVSDQLGKFYPYTDLGNPSLRGDKRTAAAQAQDAIARLQAPAQPPLSELELVEDRRQGVVWEYMTPRGRPSFTPRLLREMSAAQAYIARIAEHEGSCPFQYLVTASRMEGMFNLGGDLPRFVELIRASDRQGLLRYARSCIAVQWGRASNLGLPLRTISLVQGDALGGGFECALAGDVIIAERSATFALPEILFGLFPGMGAYSFLTRRISPVEAERMILSGRVYTADEMYQAGLVDCLLDDGEGEGGVYDFIRKERRELPTRRALSQMRQRVHPVSEAELLDIVELWVDTALTLDATQLRKMERLAQAQDRRFGQHAGVTASPGPVDGCRVDA